MSSSLTQVLELARYAKNNVLPPVQRRSSQSGGYAGSPVRDALFSPNAVHLLQASGGFNSVIELSGYHLPQPMRFQSESVGVDRTPAPAALFALISNANPSGPLAGLGPIWECSL